MIEFACSEAYSDVTVFLDACVCGRAPVSVGVLIYMVLRVDDESSCGNKAILLGDLTCLVIN